MRIRGIAIHKLESEVNHKLEIINNWMKFNRLHWSTQNFFLG